MNLHTAFTVNRGVPNFVKAWLDSPTDTGEVTAFYSLYTLRLSIKKFNKSNPMNDFPMVLLKTKDILKTDLQIEFK
jgi:hypothetical protein